MVQVSRAGQVRRTCRCMILLASLLLATSTLAVAETNSARSTADEQRVLVAEGSATIYHGDIAGARDRAVQAAMLRALERSGGVHLEARTMIVDDEILGHEVQARTRGFVRGYELLAASRDGDVAHVRIRVALSEQPAERVLRRLQDGRTLVLIATDGLEPDAALEVMRNQLASPFPGSHVTLPTAEMAADRLFSGSGARAPDPALVRAVGSHSGAGVLVVASATTEELADGVEDIGYRVPPEVTLRVACASGNVMVLSAAGGEVLAGRRFAGRRAADPADIGTAARRSVEALAEQMRAFVADYLVQHLRDQERTLRVEMTGPGVAGERLRQLLQVNRWTEEVATLELSAGRAVVVVRARVPAPLYVEDLRVDPALEIVRFDPAASELYLRLAR